MRFFDGIEEDLKSHERKFSQNLNFLNDKQKLMKIYYKRKFETNKKLFSENHHNENQFNFLFVKIKIPENFPIFITALIKVECLFRFFLFVFAETKTSQ